MRSGLCNGSAVLRLWRTSAVVTLFAIGLAGCAGTPEPDVSSRPAQPSSAGRVASSIPVEKLVGRWGVASYREAKDRARTEAMARAQCKLPYVITKGPTDGVMMHVADDTKLYELTLKGASDGKTYLGFEAPPGDEMDRLILSFSDSLIEMRYVGEEVNSRYGTYLYVRCK